MYSKHDDKSKYKKKVTVIAGDSIINHLQGWRLSDTNNHVVLKSFSGATIEDMEDYLKPVIRKEPESIVLHIGTNHRSIVEEEAENNDLTRFERFKRWAKRNQGGISVVAISVAWIITTIVVGARNAVKRSASATSKLAKTLGKIAEKAAPVLGALLNLAAGVLKLGAKAVWFFSENLWLLAVMIAYALYDRARTKGRASS